MHPKINTLSQWLNCSTLWFNLIYDLWNISFQESRNVKYFEEIKRLKSLQKAEAYLEPMQASTMELFCEYT